MVLFLLISKFKAQKQNTQASPGVSPVSRPGVLCRLQKRAFPFEERLLKKRSKRNRQSSRIQYNQFLVVWAVSCPCTNEWQVSWLMDPQSMPPSQLLSGRADAQWHTSPQSQ